jgi:hypothetical protein
MLTTRLVHLVLDPQLLRLPTHTLEVTTPDTLSIRVTREFPGSIDPSPEVMPAASVRLPLVHRRPKAGASVPVAAKAGVLQGIPGQSGP